MWTAPKDSRNRFHGEGDGGRRYLRAPPTHGPAISTFPDTRLSVLEALRAADPTIRRGAGDVLVRAYRSPILADLTWRWRLDPADAEDLVQEFFATALDRQWLDRFDPAKGRFRAYLRLAAHRFASKAHQASTRQKRGGAVTTIPLDQVELPSDAEADARFRAAWVREVFELALARLGDEAAAGGREIPLAIFRAYDVEGDGAQGRPTYRDLANTHHLEESQVLNHLAWARRRFRHHVLAVLRELAGGEQEYRDDVRDLLGIVPP